MEKSRLPKVPDAPAGQAASPWEERKAAERAERAQRFQANLLKFQQEEMKAAQRLVPCPAGAYAKGITRYRPSAGAELVLGPSKYTRKAAGANANAKFKKTVSFPNFSSVDSGLCENEASSSEQARRQREMSTSSEVNLFEYEPDQTDQGRRETEKFPCGVFTARPNEIYGKELDEPNRAGETSTTEPGSPSPTKIVRLASSKSATALTTPKIVGAVLKTGEKVQFVYSDDERRSSGASESIELHQGETQGLSSAYASAGSAYEGGASSWSAQTDSASACTAPAEMAEIDYQIDFEDCFVGTRITSTLSDLSEYATSGRPAEVQPVIELYKSKPEFHSPSTDKTLNFTDSNHPKTKTSSPSPKASINEALTSADPHLQHENNEMNEGSISILNLESGDFTSVVEPDVIRAHSEKTPSDRQCNRFSYASLIEIRETDGHLDSRRWRACEKKADSGCASILSSQSHQRRLASVQNSVGRVRTSFRKALAQTCRTHDISGGTSYTSLVSAHQTSASNLDLQEPGESIAVHDGASGGEHTSLSKARDPEDELSLSDIWTQMHTGYTHISSALWGAWEFLSHLVSTLTCFSSKKT